MILRILHCLRGPSLICRLAPDCPSSLYAARVSNNTLASAASDADKLAGKAAVFSQLRADYQRWRDARWQGTGPYDHWFAGELNNARLLPFGLYDQWIPAFAELYRTSGSWPAFYQAVERLANLSDSERTAALLALLERGAERS